MSFEQALSGLNAATENLDAIGNNIANASTIGFKQGRAEFADVFAASMAGGSGTQIGIGTRLAAVSPQFTQGNITTTGNPMDVAINGQGLFRIAHNGAISYSRDGEFSLDKNGFIVNSSGGPVTRFPDNTKGTHSTGTPVPPPLCLDTYLPTSTSHT